MNTLLRELTGWIGYLERLEVCLQIGLAILFLILPRILLSTSTGAKLPKPLKPFLGPCVGAAGILVLQALHIRTGLLQFFVTSWLGWSILFLAKKMSSACLPKQQVNEFFSHIINPLYLIFITLSLVNKLDSAQDLAVVNIITFFDTKLTLGKLLSSLLIVYFLLVGSGPPAALASWTTQKLIGFSNGSRKAFELIIRYSVIGIGLTIIGVQIGLNTTALFTIAGGLSVGLGFGIKEVFSNFVSGLWLLVEGSVRPGEVLMVEGDPCEVRKLGLRATMLWRDRDNAELLIPNQMFFTAPATTFTASDRMRRSEIRIGAAYRHDPKIVLRLLEETALSVDRVLPTPRPKALLMSYGDSAINYSLRFWIDNPMDNISIVSEVNQEVWSAFQREEIEIPFPQRVNTIVESSSVSPAPAAADTRP